MGKNDYLLSKKISTGHCIMFNQFHTSSFWTRICWLFEKLYLYDKVALCYFPKIALKALMIFFFFFWEKKKSRWFVWCFTHLHIKLKLFLQAVSFLSFFLSFLWSQSYLSCFHIWDSIHIFLAKIAKYHVLAKFVIN